MWTDIQITITFVFCEQVGQILAVIIFEVFMIYWYKKSPLSIAEFNIVLF